MQNRVNAADASPSDPVLESADRKIVFLLSCLAAVHVFIFTAAIPFFSNVDEQIHFDLAVKYSQLHIPRKLETLSAEAALYPPVYGCHEFLWPSNDFPAEKFPPPWTQPLEQTAPRLLAAKARWLEVKNYEASQPPLYYSLAGLWWRLGKLCGFHDGHLLYWLRFMNLLVVAGLVWLGFAAARLVFPENRFLRLGVPALIAFLPQSAFYSLQNDVMSPLCFGAAFLCLVRWLGAEMPGARLGAVTGLMLAATFLTKISNLPLLAVAGAAVLYKAVCLAKTGKLRAAGPALTALALCAGLPMLAWLAWCKYAFGDFTGTAAKIQYLGWTLKPFSDWWRHPIFTPHGLWTFVSGLMATLWQGELLWHRRPLALPVVDVIYTLSSVGFVAVAVGSLCRRSAVATVPQRQALWLGFGCFLAAVGFLGFLSILYDFHNCFYPSREHPYFTSGRLMLGALIPFLLLYLYGLDRLLGRVKQPWVRPLVLVGMILFMLISETLIDGRLFPNAYNWYHQ